MTQREEENERIKQAIDRFAQFLKNEIDAHEAHLKRLEYLNQMTENDNGRDIDR